MNESHLPDNFRCIPGLSFFVNEPSRRIEGLSRLDPEPGIGWGLPLLLSVLEARFMELVFVESPGL